MNNSHEVIIPEILWDKYKLWSVTLYIDWYLYPGIICYKYLANLGSAEYHAIQLEQFPVTA